MSRPSTATAIAHPNIAFVKYWGNRDQALRLPANGSISMTLGGLQTRTTVTFDPTLAQDELLLDGAAMTTAPLQRVSEHLDRIRALAGTTCRARVQTDNSFPMAAGLASSSSAFAALTLAACSAASLDLDPRSLSRLARLGSGSACRSIFRGFVEWYAGENDAQSFAETIAPPEHWDLVDLIALVSHAHKQVSSTAGHSLAATSPLQEARTADAPRRLGICRQSILTHNFPRFASIVEQDSNLMHAVMLTSTPSLIYWAPETITLIEAISSWRAAGLNVCYSIDAGPNVHCLCTRDAADELQRRLAKFPGVRSVLRAHPGEAARLDEAQSSPR